MSQITRTYSFTDGTTAYGSQVETEVQGIVTAWNNHDSASSSWTALGVIGNASVGGTLAVTGAVTLTAALSVGTNLIVNSTDLKTDSTNHRVGIGVTPSFTLDVGGTAITTRLRSTTGALTLNLASGSSGGTNDVKTTYEDGSGSLWALGVDASDAKSFKLSSGAALGTTDRLTIDVNGNIAPGSAALATTATDGFIYIQTCAGPPTGIPTAFTGRCAIVFDTSNNKLYVYDGGWIGATLS